MSSLLGDFPESPFHRTLRWIGYFVIGVFFSLGPLALALLLAAIHHLATSDMSLRAAMVACVVCAAWTAHMGMTGRLMIPNRVFSGLVYIGYILIAGTISGESAFKAGMNLFLPVMCIWFGDLMGGYTGYMSNHPIDERSPGVIIIFLGWCFMVGVPILSGIISLQL